MPNPDKKLWPNQFVKARLLLDIEKDALVVPAPAIQRGPKGTFVYVVDDAQKAQPRDVEADESKATARSSRRGSPTASASSPTARRRSSRAAPSKPQGKP